MNSSLNITLFKDNSTATENRYKLCPLVHVPGVYAAPQIWIGKIFPPIVVIIESFGTNNSCGHAPL